LELAFQHSVHPACFLLGAQLAVIVRFSFAAELSAFAMLTRSISAVLKSTLRRETARSLEEQFFTFSPA
jgi:hypothetical protein